MCKRLLFCLSAVLGLVRSMPLPYEVASIPLDMPLGMGSCIEALRELQGNMAVLAQMLVATGKDIPYDAGKYSVCMNIEEAYGIPMKFFIVTYRFGDLPGEIGVCLPASCNNEDIPILRDLLAAQPNSTAARIAQGISFPKQYTGFDFPPPAMTVVYPNPFNDKDNRLAWGDGTTAALAIWAVLIVVVVYCSIMQRFAITSVTQRPSLRSRLLTAFALFGPDGSWTALIKAEPYRPSDSLNGLRVLSMIWVIMGHGITQPQLVSGFRNAECIKKTPVCLDAASTSPFIDIIFAGDCAVDTFFFIGGFLLSFVGMNRPTPVIMGTILRYARLLPCLGFTMMVYVLIAPYWTTGPFSPRFQNDVFENCNNNTWWAELLFISAFFPWNNPKACMGWSWYLGLDMFFAILGLVLLNIWKRFKVLAWLLVAVLAAACLAVTMQQSLHYNMQYSLFGPNEAIYQFHLYAKFYGRLPVFLVGLTAPWAMRLLERGTQPQSGLAFCAVRSCCVLAVLAGACCIFVPALNSDGPGPSATARKVDNWTPWQNAAWIAFSRPLWAISLLVVVAACYYEYLPLLDMVLSHRAWGPLTKLTYGAYLLHPVIIKSLAASARDYYNFSYMEALFHTAGHATLAYCGSAGLWCLVERPMASLTGLLVPKRRQAPQTKPSPACSTSESRSLSCTVEEGRPAS